MIPAAQAAPTWECRASADGQGWECFKGGVFVEPEPVAPAPPITKTEPTPAEPPEQPAPIARKPAPAPAVATEPKPAPTKPARPVAEAEPKPEARPEPQAEEVAKAAEPEADAPVKAQPAIGGGIDRGLNWEQCGLPFKRRDQLTTIPEVPSDDRTYITADAAEVLQDEEAASFSGNVEVRRGNELVEADEIHYNRIEDTLNAKGNLYYQRPNMRFTSTGGSINLSSHQGNLENVEYRLTDRMARGSADHVDIQDSERSHYDEISYTTCRPGNSDWMLVADEMDIDQSTGTGEAYNAKLSFMGVPFLYTPYVNFPIDDRRKSGFLVPTIGNSSETGFDLATPYYFNLAPNYDATFTPRVMSKRGVMLGGEFRYLTTRHEGEVSAEILPNDGERDSGDNKTRGAFSFQNRGQLSPRWGLDIDANYVSDEEYLEDLGGSLAVSSARHLERRGDIYYRGNGWAFRGRTQYYQTLDKDLALSSRPYHRLPQFLLVAGYPDRNLGLRYNLRSEYVYFDRNDSVTGHRLDLLPSVSLPMRKTWGFLKPKLSARYTTYQLQDEAAGNPDDPDRFIPSFSLDGGLFFDRTTSWFGQTVEQTLEPRIFYLLVDEDNQDDIPLFDSSRRSFSFNYLFQENRFNGADRIGDANQLTLALTSRTRADGREILRASLGSILYFEDREVQLRSTTPKDDDDTSAVVAELAARLSDNWSTRASLQWNPHEGERHTEKSAVHLRYRGEEQRIFNLSYRLTRDLVEHTDLSFRWPIGAYWHLLARWNYSLMHNRTMEAFGGIEYASCCWAVRAVARNYVNDDDEKANTAFFLQLELKGLARFGSDIDSLLERGILGYTPTN